MFFPFFPQHLKYFDVINRSCYHFYFQLRENMKIWNSHPKNILRCKTFNFFRSNFERHIFTSKNGNCQKNIFRCESADLDLLLQKLAQMSCQIFLIGTMQQCFPPLRSVLPLFTGVTQPTPHLFALFLNQRHSGFRVLRANGSWQKSGSPRRQNTSASTRNQDDVGQELAQFLFFQQEKERNSASLRDNLGNVSGLFFGATSQFLSFFQNLGACHTPLAKRHLFSTFCCRVFIFERKLAK